MKKFYIVLVGLILGLITGVDAFAQQTWYALNSGEWNNPDNWTLDPAAAIYVTEDEGYPLEGDDVVIKSGRTITMPTEGDSFSAHCNVLTVDGRLDLKNTSGHNFSEIRGSGRIIMEGDNFPSGDASNFVGEGKGTVVYKGSGYDISDHTFYNVEIDLEGTDPKVNLAGDLTVNGNFSVLNGNFQFGNNNTTRTLTVKGNITVNNGASMTVNSANAAHNLYSRGNITNNGSIQFTNLSNPDYDSTPTDGYVILTVKGESNTVLTANNTTFLQRLILDKGSDRTYRFTVNPSQREYFRLFGQNDTVSEEKALYIKNGTLELTGATYIHSLTEGGDDFYVPETGGFWINGGAVEVNSTAVSNNADGFTSTGVEVNAVGSQSFSVLGKFRITDGTLNTHTHGFVAWDSGNALVQIEGGTVKTPGFRSAGNQEGRWTYNQSGGHVFMKGGIESDLNPQGKATFSIEGVNNVFIMTGGTMEIQDAATGNDLAIDIQSGEGKFNVTGGTIKINRIAGTSGEFNISSTAPFFNLEIAGVSNTATALLNSELTVLNDLIVRENGILDVTSNNYALNIGRDLTLESGSSIDLRSNITSFIGSQNSVITVAEGLSLNFNNVDVNKEISYNGYFEVSSSGSGVNIEGDLNVTRGNFVVSASGINIGGSIYLFDGNISGGSITLNGNTQQTLYSKYRKEKSIGDFNFDNSGSKPQIILASDLLINSLSFNRDQVVMLGNYNLELANSQLSTTGWGNSRMFATNGRASNGGLTLPVVLDGSYNDDIAQYFPIGYTVDGEYYFTPATVRVDGALNDSGSINVKHVAANHPTVDNPNDVAPYYWKTSYSGLSTVGSSNMRYIFTYFENISNVPSGKGMIFTANNEWYDAGNDVRDGSNLYFDYGDPLLTDYTYGKNNAFNNVRTLYSLTSGPFNQSSTWTESADHQGSSTSRAPRSYDMVVIGGANGVNHTVTISGDERASQVYIKGKSETGIGVGDDNVDPPTFEVTSGASGAATYNYSLWGGWGYVSGNEFSSIKGKGRFLIHGDNMPSADFSEFCNGNEAIFEYTGIGAYSIPESSYVTLKLFGVIDYGQELIFELNQYPNLHITESGTKTAGDIDLTVNGNLFVEDATFNISNQNNGDIDIVGNLEINTGNLVLPNTESRVLNVDGDFFFSGDGDFYVSGGGSAIEHSVNLYGNLMQESGAIDLSGNTAKANIYFIGSNSVEFSKSGTDITNFNRVYINKPIGEQVLFSGNFNLNSNLNNDNTKTLVLQSGNAYLDNSALNIELSSGGGMYKIPAVSELIVNQGTISLGGSDPNGAGLWLDGKLTINDGGKAQFDEGTNNYIEYTSSGKSEIEVNGSGELYVGSQIRRSPYTEAGILKFSQNSDASTIEIGTKDAGESTRGVFEILNTGSSFTQAAGAKLTIKNSKAGGFTDFYFDPESVSLGEGSTIEIAAGNEASEPFDMYVNQPLENLTFSGNVEGKLKTVPVEILGNLSIGTNSVFNTNGLDVTIHGDMTNEGSYNANENTTYFSGLAGQSITGNTEFYNLVKNEGTDTLRIGESSAVTIANDLTLNTGIFDTGENDVSVKGDFYIAGGAYTVSGSERNGVVLNGTSSQELSGGGTIARLMVDNAAGVVVPTQSSAITFSDVLKLNNGILDIGRNLLVLTENAVIEGDDSDSFSSSNMVQTNLSFTDAGIKKYFPADVVSNFVYPIGASGKYTPVVMENTTNGNEGGSIRVKAANEPHITIPVEDLDNVLQYNWTLDAEGISNFTANVAMHGYPADVRGDTASYITARILDEEEGIWNKYSVDDFDGVNTILNFSFEGTNDAGIDGDYTAGTDEAIPDKVQTFVTEQDGFWNDPDVWSVVGGGVVPAGGPRGAIVQINHEVNLQVNGHAAYKTEISGSGVVNVGNTLNHRLGKVSGTGTVVVESGSLPAGEYTEFFSENGGTLEYSGSSNYSVLAELPQVNNLVFSGSGQRILPNLDVDILGDFVIEGGNVINEESRPLTIRGNMSRTGGSFDVCQGTIKLQGDEVQTINGSFTDENALYNIEVNNVAGLTLNGPVDVGNVITFTKGIISTSETALLTVLNSDNAAVNNASHLRYVNGPMQKKINAGTMFDFPVGDDYRYGNIGVKPATTGLWTAQYFDHAASEDGYSENGVTYVSQNEYWSVKAANADDAEIKLRWDSESGVNPDSPDFLVISYEPSAWGEVNFNNKTGDVSGGSVMTETLYHNTERLFTFGSGSMAEYTWLGTISTDWFDGGNWAGGYAPSAADFVIVDTGSSNNPVIGEGMDAYCSNLTIETGKTVTLKPGASLEIKNNIDNNGTIILESTNSNLSSLMLPDSPTKTGSVNVKLKLEANKKFYLSSPIKDAKLNWFYPDGHIDNDFVYVFREDPKWKWIRVDDAYISENPDLNELEAVYGRYLQEKELNFSGEVNNSDVTKTYGRGYYLVGNPFPTAIDWENPAGWVREGFSNTIWSWVTIGEERVIQTYNNGGDNLPGAWTLEPEGYDESNISHIAPYQSVQMKIETTNADLTIKRTARVRNSDAPLKSASNETFSYNLIRIQTNNNLLFDGTVIYFNEAFSEGIGDEDSEKQFNSSENVPEIYTRINNSAYAINGFPELTDSEYSIPISVRNRVEADVTMAFDLKEFGGGYTVYLEDKETGSWINLLQQSEYVYTPAQMGDDHDRFVLHLEKIQQVATGINQPDTESTDDIEIVGYEDYAQIQISNELLQTSDAEIDLLDMNGRLLNKVTTRQTQNNVDLPDNSGVYIICVNIGDVVKTGKVVR